MHVLVTGGAGFIGHHLVAALLRAGHQVVVLDNLRRGSFERPGLQGARLLTGDIREIDACVTALDGCDSVIHLAAQSNVIGSEADPDYTFETNVLGTWNIARAVAAAGVRALVFASSREVYGDADRLPVAEDTLLRPKNIYGASKVAGEALLAGGAAGHASVRVLRLANVIGPCDAGRVVPNWLAAVRDGVPIDLYGGDQLLDFVPIGTAVAAFMRALTVDHVDGPINVGSGRPTPLRELAERLLEMYPSTQADVRVLPARGAEVVRFAADTSRMTAILGIDPPADPLATLPGPGDEPW